MQPHNIALTGTIASGAATVANALGDNPSWQTVALNLGITLISGLFSAWMKKRQSASKGGEK